MAEKLKADNMIICELGEKKLVGLRVVCEGDEYVHEIPKAVKKLTERQGEIKHLVQPVKQIGAFTASTMSEEEDGYWVCFETERFEDVPEDMATLIIPAQTYAVLTYKGPAETIFSMYSQLHIWVEKQKYDRQPHKWSLEIYSDWENKDNVSVELCDPVTARGEAEK